MPGMVMQMPGRHVSLSQPFLMDQIIQTPFDTIAPLCSTYIWTPKEHFCSRMLTWVGYFMKHATMRRALFRNNVAWSQSQPQKHNSCLFLSHNSDPAKAQYTPELHLRATDLHHKTDSLPDKAHNATDWLYHISSHRRYQVKGAQHTESPFTDWVYGLLLLDLRELVWIKTKCGTFLKLTMT